MKHFWFNNNIIDIGRYSHCKSVTNWPAPYINLNKEDNTHTHTIGKNRYR